MSFARPMKILHVDDDEINRIVLDHMLQSFGHETFGVAGATEALQALRATRFDLIMTDLHMPDVTGQGLLAAIRAGEAGLAAIPVIAVSADLMSHPPQAYRGMGFANFLAKPLTLAQLESAIDEVRFGPEGRMLEQAGAATEAHLRGIAIR